jgi:two-component SAPR family response regulator
MCGFLLRRVAPRRGFLGVGSMKDGGLRNGISRVLVLEDEMLVAFMLEDMLAHLGIQVCGPAHSVSDALDLLQTQAFDAALLDANLAGESSLPFAEQLADRGIPFAFATGYGPAATHHFPNVPFLRKPYTQEQIAATLRKLGVLAP